MNDNATLVCLAVLTLAMIVLCSGDPDIIDGWVTMANGTECEQVDK